MVALCTACILAHQWSSAMNKPISWSYPSPVKPWLAFSNFFHATQSFFKLSNLFFIRLAECRSLVLSRNWFAMFLYPVIDNLHSCRLPTSISTMMSWRNSFVLSLPNWHLWTGCYWVTILSSILVDEQFVAMTNALVVAGIRRNASLLVN